MVRSPVDSCCDSCCDWLQASPLLSTFRAVNLESGRQGAQLVQLNCQIADARSRRPSHIASFVCLFVCPSACLFACLLAWLFACLFVCLFVCLSFSVNFIDFLSYPIVSLFVNQSVYLRLRGSTQAETHTHTKKKCSCMICTPYTCIGIWMACKDACQCLGPIGILH